MRLRRGRIGAVIAGIDLGTQGVKVLLLRPRLQGRGPRLRGLPDAPPPAGLGRAGTRGLGTGPRSGRAPGLAGSGGGPRGGGGRRGDRPAGRLRGGRTGRAAPAPLPDLDGPARGHPPPGRYRGAPAGRGRGQPRPGPPGGQGPLAPGAGPGVREGGLLPPAGLLPGRSAHGGAGMGPRPGLDQHALRPGPRGLRPRLPGGLRPFPRPAAADRRGGGGGRRARAKRAPGSPACRRGTPVAVGTGDDYASPLGAGMVEPGAVACISGTAEVVGALCREARLDPAGLVETHCYPGGCTSSRTRAGCPEGRWPGWPRSAACPTRGAWQSWLPRRPRARRVCCSFPL